MIRSTCAAFGVLILLSLSQFAWATETENLGIRILPPPGPVNIDGKTDDWDLTGGIFACGDAESQHDKYGVWIHAMYDADNLYLLARWVDETPMNNPGSVKGSYGFNGDCLQFRIVTDPGSKSERVSHWTCWMDKDGLDAMGSEYGHKFNEPGVNAKKNGAQQAFLKNPDGKGYAQEIKLPWKILAQQGVTPAAGQKIEFTVEPNFTVAGSGRMTIKDIFKPGVGIDRVFTFQNDACWGWGTLQSKGHVDPQPVRLSDTREFPMTMAAGTPVVDWTGLILNDEPKGFKTLHFALPNDGFVSLNLFNADGQVVRQLLRGAFYTKGEHDVKWDGLTTPSFKKPGKPVPPGEYHWEGLYNTGIGLKLRGWADAGSAEPWDGWGGDHGNPVAAASDDQRVYLGWNGGEGSKPLIAVNPAGQVLWRNIRGGIADAQIVASDGKTVYVFNSEGQYAPVSIYRLDARTGAYTEWSSLKSTDLSLKPLIGETTEKISGPSGLAANGGKVFVSFAKLNSIVVINAGSGDVIKKLDVPHPGAMFTADGNKLFVLSDGHSIQAVDVDSGKVTPAVQIDLPEKAWASGLTMDKAGNFYVGSREGDNQVMVFSPDGKLQRTIGRKGGRVQKGVWNPDGMIKIASLAIDPKGKLWVAEDDASPRRVSVWDAPSGAFATEYLGPSSYGAGGSVIDPVDPNLMVGQGVEWRIDPATGHATPVQYVTTSGMAQSRYGFGPDKKLYLAVAPDALHGTNPVSIFERKSDSEYKLRTVIKYQEKNKKRLAVVWSDQNDDGQQQPEEVHEYPLPADYFGWITGWYMPMTPSLTFYGSNYQLKVAGWTACGAPEYDFSKMEKMPASKNVKFVGGMGAQKGHGSADDRLMLYNGVYGEDYATFDCYDIASGKMLWQYPNNFTGVHGSHRAPGPIVGLIRGAYDIVGSAKLPAPVGNVWVIPTNKGEWHVLTEKGFYLTHLFQSDPMKWDWPEKAVPGAIMDNVPPGAGEEAFGGSITMGVDGNLYVQCGHTSFWNLQVTGLDTVKSLPESGDVKIEDGDIPTAQTYAAAMMQANTGLQRMTIKKSTPSFTGDLAKDFAGQQVVGYQKQANAAVHTAAAWDEKNLYLAWEVKDDTPWVNNTDAADYMYKHGDTVDLQLGADPAAPKDRKTAALGDLRLSIGNFQGKPTAVIYRLVAKDKHPQTFSSGVIKAYEMDSVLTLTDVNVQVKVDKIKHQYTVEAAISLADLDLHPADGLKIRGDFGVTQGDKVSGMTVLRTYWNNQDTGIVSDAVFEIQMQPSNWGELVFQAQ